VPEVFPWGLENSHVRRTPAIALERLLGQRCPFGPLGVTFN
jgi:hypothetical protein